MFLFIFFIVGCYDRFYEPGILSTFSDVINIKGQQNGRVNFEGKIKPNSIYWEMVENSKYLEISVYKEDKLLYTYSEEQLERLRQENPNDIIIWKLSEEGIELISKEEAKQIYEENEKRKKIKKKKRKNNS